MINETDTAQEESNGTPPGQLNEEALINEITANLKEGRKHWAKWRREAKEDYDFFAGNQWDGNDIAKLEEENRPVVTFNRTGRTINAVVGLELQNRQEVRYVPREISDTGVNETLTNAGKWARDNCDAEDEESEMFQDSVICGVGWTDSLMDYEIDVEGQIIVERIDPLEMVVDPNSKKRNFADARWVAHIKQVTKKELKAMWPNADVMPSQFWLDSDTDDHDATEAPFYREDQSDKLPQMGKCVVVRYQWWERVPCISAADPATGKLVEMSPDKFVMAQQLMAAQGVELKFARGHKRVYKQVFLSGRTLLEPPKELGCNHFTLQAVTGMRDRNTNTWFGLVRLMKDPQRWANKWLSQIQHILNTSAKNGIYAEKSAITNPAKFEETHNQSGTISFVADGALSQGKIQPKEPARYPDGIDRLLQYAMSAINDVTGVSLEMIGMTDRDQPIGLEESRKKAGLTILATFFDSLRRYRKTQGRIMAYYIKEYIADGRLVRIVGDQGAQYVPLLKDELTYKYDVIVDDAPTSPNMKERVFMVLNQILPMLLQAGIPIPPDVLDYAPIPDALQQKWKKMLSAQQEDPMAQMMKQIQSMMAQLELQDKQADIEKKKSEATKNYAQAEQAHATGQDESAQAMQKVGLANHEHQIKTDGMMREQHRKDLEMLMNQARKMQEAKANMSIKAMQAKQKPELQ
jgi:hypothetical protein